MGIALITANSAPLVFDGVLEKDRVVRLALAIWAILLGAVGGTVSGTLARWSRWASAIAFVVVASFGIWLPLILSGRWGGQFDLEGEPGSSASLGAGVVGWLLLLGVEYSVALVVGRAGHSRPDAHSPTGSSTPTQ